MQTIGWACLFCCDDFKLFVHLSTLFLFVQCTMQVFSTKYEIDKQQVQSGQVRFACFFVYIKALPVIWAHRDPRWDHRCGCNAWNLSLGTVILTL